MLKVDNSKAITKEIQQAITPAMAIDLLKEGNRRFVENRGLDINYRQQMAATLNGQWPYAAILGCIDSRVPSEILFDQGIGNLFNARVAGNFANTDIMGSLEYACGVAGSKLILVLGHKGCGAVKAACDNVQVGNITHMLSNIMPAVFAVEEEGERNSNNARFVQNVAEMNVRLNIDKIRRNSPMLKDLEDNGSIMIVGGIYHIDTGEVKFLE